MFNNHFSPCSNAGLICYIWGMIDYVRNFNKTSLRHLKIIVKYAGVLLKTIDYGPHSVSLYDVGGEFVEVFYNSHSREIICIKSIYPDSDCIDDYINDIEIPT